ncbi:MAG: hypothetical protein QW498_09115 [Thermofilum sp.]
MSFDKYKVRRLQRFTSTLWNSLMDELNRLEKLVSEVKPGGITCEDLAALSCDIVPDEDGVRSLGSETSSWAAVHSKQGFFYDGLFVQGRPVLKDGDPITVSDIYVRVAELYDADATVEQSVTLDTGGFKTVGILAVSEAPTIFTVEISFDGVHWFSVYISPAVEHVLMDVMITAARYVRVRSSPVSEQGKKVSIAVGAKP